MIDFLKDRTCCEDRGIDDPDAQDCLDKWREKLEDVSNEYNKLSAETSKDEEEYLNSLGWQNRLKNWDERIKDTDEKANEVLRELEFFLEQAKLVCDNSEVTTDALEQLLGLGKSIFDCFFTYQSKKEGLKDMIVDFKKTIECLKNSSDEDKAEVMKCIETYEQKIIVVCDMQDAILKQLLETYKCASLLSVAICGDGGLEDKIEDLEDIFKGDDSMGGDYGDYPSGDDDDDDNDDGKKTRKKRPRHDHDNSYSYPCNDMIVKPMPKFPINDSDYYNNIESDLVVAINETERLRKEWVQSKKESDKSLSHKTSLIEAITAAEAAENAK
ncbi:hypothetical protein U6A24_08015 [Aquimarina gracilis]|uniref:Uncharacterized protein n=1 Tax=Aquimarina gracilis TaxID=874422 RepID=A0ABU5ZTT8_9FLAO|nr:hypothetical protein [Aquimarina gracilis]MEB3345398.1 hypothetical protein [Aquimarina gracilis]